jgi:hypothetical protein
MWLSTIGFRVSKGGLPPLFNQIADMESILIRTTK